ncbi:helix-turn-helix domain-containing protein [Streptomyces sp. NPDC020801]|uniref:helix-turn-helix domain-containing protein n=1 Tax=Streptomyces sp. NPDC020801 TaxID=3365093 RepID=UPI0037A81F17
MGTTRNPVLEGEDRRIVAREFAQLYRAGSSIRGIARQTGRSYGCVHQLLEEAGVQFRPRGATRPY